MASDGRGSIRERLPEVGCVGNNPPSPCPKHAKRLGHGRHVGSTGKPEAVSAEEGRQVLRRIDSLGPQNGPVAIYNANGVPYLKAGLKAYYMRGHLFNTDFLENV